MNAIYVTYNGVFSAQYGLKLGSFGGNDSTEERTIFDPSISTQKAKNMKHFYITNIVEENAPEVEMTLISDAIIHDINKREILAWLNSGSEFKKLIIHRPETEEFYYMCRFREISEIMVNGFCVGFKMIAVLNSPYQYGVDTMVTLNDGNYTDKLINIFNKSDIIDDYVYPLIRFTITSGNSIQITNMSDDENRVFELVDLPQNKEITIDNELKIIDGDGVFLANFNKHWLRLKKGKNILKITLTGKIKITCPQFVSVGF